VIAAALCAVSALVVLDPGHGGDEPGAEGPNGVLEKDVVLDIARRARERLREEGVRVRLTRSADVTLSLGDRKQIAEGADAFLSRSTSTRRPSASRRGLEVYVGLGPRHG
jgi:N-acetylmuramoyl-L-alanine amidase